MKTKKWMMLGVGSFVCVLGLSLGVHASTKQIVPMKPQVIQTQIEPVVVNEEKEVVVETLATDVEQVPEIAIPKVEEVINPVECPNGHINCDGNHANGECPYGNEPGSGPKDGSGYRQGNCVNAHMNCDGNHANGECPYGNEPGNGPKDGTGYQQGNGHGGRHGSGQRNGTGAHCQR